MNTCCFYFKYIAYNSKWNLYLNHGLVLNLNLCFTVTPMAPRLVWPQLFAASFSAPWHTWERTCASNLSRFCLDVYMFVQASHSFCAKSHLITGPGYMCNNFVNLLKSMCCHIFKKSKVSWSRNSFHNVSVSRSLHMVLLRKASGSRWY